MALAPDLMDALLLLTSGLGAWIMRIMWTAIRDLQAADRASAEKVASIEVLVSGSYITRQEYRDDARAMFAALQRIEEKLDSKVDK